MHVRMREDACEGCRVWSRQFSVSFHGVKTVSRTRLVGREREGGMALGIEGRKGGMYTVDGTGGE